MTATRSPITDLMSRSSGGVDVTLFWNPGTAQVTLELADRGRRTVTTFDVAPARARYAFEHPYAYAYEQRCGLLAA